MNREPELKHERVRHHLLDMATRELRPGDMLPGERVLEEQLGVSRITIRRAISDLVNDGVLVRVKGKGTFVSHGRVRSALHLASFNEDMLAAGHQPSTRVITAEVDHPGGEAESHLRVPGPDDVFLLRRLRLADAQPVSVDESWLPAHRLPGLRATELTGSLYGLLAADGLPVTHVEQTVEAAAASSQMAGWLQIAEGSPVLLFRRRSYSGEIPVEYCLSTYRADRYQLSMRLTVG
ncbi:GntR family transcriptional regulator [Kocuria sp.]|uniref:GntR family transcriptional regulator n=1 Tax=Kocuria sp. TaxID=1871328 RepID=UPI0026DDA521|nr:GntR family transcriptional regulator [Kocuria sp.]MDO4919057.1 GntR family transcriptional regulator [Kocuria sp.]